MGYIADVLIFAEKWLVEFVGQPNGQDDERWRSYKIEIDDNKLIKIDLP